MLYTLKEDRGIIVLAIDFYAIDLLNARVCA